MNKHNKGVLIVTSHYPPNIGGVESHLTGLVSGLTKRNWNVVISTYQPLASSKKAGLVERSNNLIVYRLPWPGFNIVHRLAPYPLFEFIYLFPGLLLITFIALLKHYKEVDVVHCQGLVPTVVGLIAKIFFRKRVVSSVHNLYFFPKKGLYPEIARIIFSSVDVMLSPTKVSKNELRRIRIPENKISFFRYWLNLSYFSPTKKREAKNKLKWKKFSVLFVGRLIETKGVGILLDVVKRLNSDVQLIMIGDGPMAEQARSVQDRYSNFTFLGRVENKKLPLYYSAADLIVVPSTVDEGWGFVAMEAISCGTPVLASNMGGLSDVISNSTGLLVQPSPKNFRDKIQYFHKHKKNLQRLTKNCRKWAMKHFGEDNVEDIIRSYER